METHGARDVAVLERSTQVGLRPGDITLGQRELPRRGSGLLAKHLLGPFDPRAQPILEGRISLSGPYMVCDRRPNHHGHRLVVDRRDGLELSRLLSGKPDGHGFDSLHLGSMY